MYAGGKENTRLLHVTLALPQNSRATCKCPTDYFSPPHLSCSRTWCLFPLFPLGNLPASSHLPLLLPLPFLQKRLAVNLSRTCGRLNTIMEEIFHRHFLKN